MPQAEVRQWERLAIHGPGPVATAILLAELIACQSASVPGSRPIAIESLLPWLDGLYRDESDVRREREEQAETRRLDDLAAFSAANWRRQGNVGD